MRPKRSLNAEAVARKALEAKRRRQERTEQPGVAPYGLLWSELDRRAMAFTTADEKMDVWTNPDMSVVFQLKSYGLVKRRRYRYLRQPTHYLLLPELNVPTVAEENHEHHKDQKEDFESVAALPVEGRVRLVLRRGGGACGEEGEYAFRHFKLSDIPTKDSKNVRARMLARKSWRRAEQAGLSLQPELNFPVG